MSPSISGFGRYAAIIAVVVLAGCANLGYYTKSVSGHLEIWGKQRPITQLIDDPAISPDLKDKLAAVLSIREFASRELFLPDNQSYRTYADIKRAYAVWTVYAAPRLSTQLQEWCFPIAGCVFYRGYYSESAAQRFAAELQTQGFDIFVGRALAYSTLGKLTDPVLNTFVNYPQTEITKLLFHELAHQVVYIPNDTTFNESFATTVELEGTRRWLEQHGSEKLRQNYHETDRRKIAFVELITRYREKLDALYAANTTDDDKFQGKMRLFEELKADHARLKLDWGGYNGYDRWLADNPNNAMLASVVAYNQLQPAFQALLVQLGGDLPSFYEAVKQIGKLPKDERLARLRSISMQTVGIE
ncbi:MAG: aminopeptidase [Burkholderiales bacterium]